MRNIAISDIHGCKKTFIQLLHSIDYTKDDHLFLLGDYIDRGPDSKGVIDTILEMQREGYTVTCLKGNHEAMLLESLKRNDFHYTRNWMFHGGQQTVESFKVSTISEIQPNYIDFLQDLEYYHLLESHIIVHAGLNFSLGNPLVNLHAMLWERNWYSKINYNWLKHRRIIHGHTPYKTGEIKEMHKNINLLGAISIDAGCCYSSLNHLCAYDFTNEHLYFQENIDK